MFPPPTLSLDISYNLTGDDSISLAQAAIPVHDDPVFSLLRQSEGPAYELWHPLADAARQAAARAWLAGPLAIFNAAAARALGLLLVGYPAKAWARVLLEMACLRDASRPFVPFAYLPRDATLSLSCSEALIVVRWHADLPARRPARIVSSELHSPAMSGAELAALRESDARFLARAEETGLAAEIFAAWACSPA